MRFFMLIISFALSSTSLAQQTDQQGRISRVQSTQWGQIDLATYTRSDRWGRSCTCGMCGLLNGWKSQYYSQQQQPQSQYLVTSAPSPTVSTQIKKAGEAPSSAEIQRASIVLMNIGPEDIVGEYGCGVADFSIRAVEAGAKRAYGFEIDSELVQQARDNVSKAVRDGRIAAGTVVIVNRDVKEVDSAKYGISHIYAYLYQELLDELLKTGKFEGLNTVVSPLHDLKELPMASEKVGNQFVYVYKEGVVPEEQPFIFVPSEPEQVEAPKKQLPQPWTIEDFQLQMETASWCGPCRQWKQNEQRNVKVMTELVKSTGGLIPRFRLMIRWPRDGSQFSTTPKIGGGIIEWSGYTSASVINTEISRQIKNRNSQVSK